METTPTIEVEEQFIGKHMIEWDAQLIGNWLNDTVKSTRYQVNRFIGFAQSVNKLSVCRKQKQIAKNYKCHRAKKKKKKRMKHAVVCGTLTWFPATVCSVVLSKIHGSAVELAEWYSNAAGALLGMSLILSLLPLLGVPLPDLCRKIVPIHQCPLLLSPLSPHRSIQFVYSESPVPHQQHFSTCHPLHFRKWTTTRGGKKKMSKMKWNVTKRNSRKCRTK